MKPIFLIIFLFPIVLFAQETCYQTIYDQGVEAYQADDFDTAIKKFKAAKGCPDLPATNDIDEKIQEAQNGYIIAIKKARDEAIQARDDAIAAKRELEALTYIIRGQERELNELFRQAIEMYSKAIGMYPDSMSYYEKRAPLYLHEKIKEYQKAINDYLLLVEKGNPAKKAEFSDRLSYAYEQINEFDKANEALAIAVETANDNEKDIYEQKLDWANVRQEAIREKGKTKIFDKAVPISIINKSDICDVRGVRIKIGEKSYPVKGNRLKINNLKPGTYNYEITGKPNCGVVKVPCVIRGRGKIEIIANSVYYLIIDSSKASVFNPNAICKASLSAY